MRLGKPTVAKNAPFARIYCEKSGYLKLKLFVRGFKELSKFIEEFFLFIFFVHVELLSVLRFGK